MPRLPSKWFEAGIDGRFAQVGRTDPWRPGEIPQQQVLTAFWGISLPRSALGDALVDFNHVFAGDAKPSARCDRAAPESCHSVSDVSRVWLARV
jgi:hypothetical protein